jgi:hypothetical protein
MQAAAANIYRLLIGWDIRLLVWLRWRSVNVAGNPLNRNMRLGQAWRCRGCARGLGGSTDQYHPAALNKCAGAQPVDIHPSSQRGPVEPDRIGAGRAELVYQRRDRSPQEVEDL